MRFDLAEACVFVSGVTEAADQQPLERISLEFHALGHLRRSGALAYLQICLLNNQLLDNAARNATSFLAYAVAQFRYSRRIREARTIHRLRRNVELRHNQRVLAEEI